MVYHNVKEAEESIRQHKKQNPKCKYVIFPVAVGSDIGYKVGILDTPKGKGSN